MRTKDQQATDENNPRNCEHHSTAKEDQDILNKLGNRVFKNPRKPAKQTNYYSTTASKLANY